MKWSISAALAFLFSTSVVSAVSIQQSGWVNKNHGSREVSSPLHAVNLIQEFEHNRFADHFEMLKSENNNDYSMRIKEVDPSKLGIDTVKQWSGYLDNDKKHWFYWFFESRNDPKNDPVILWLTGGPGCSSLIGLFFEIGPASIDNNLKPVHNPYSWNNNASVIFLEQPIGVGFSYGEGSVDSSTLAAVDVVKFLELFFKKFPDLAKNEFHIAGDSYAGQYIPHIAHEIIKAQGTGNSALGFSLSSVLIGNGVTDPLVQYDYYEPMACGQGGYPAVLDNAACKKMSDDAKHCKELNKVCYSTGANDACAQAASFCDDMALTPYNKLGLNVFDIRGKCDHPESPLCYNELFNVEKYMNQEFVQEALGSAVKEYHDCSRDVNSKFTMTGDGNKPSSQYVAELLNNGIPVLIYAGDKDYLCHWLGNKAWSDALTWKYGEDYKNLPLKPWVNKETGEKAGEVKSFDALTFLRLADAGHLAPHDQPKNSLYMVKNWLSGNHHLDY